jgi:hypothetical protein
MRRAPRARLELTRAELRGGSSHVLARLAGIRAVDRGVLAVKPSGGFVRRLTAGAAAAREPGLWWRVRRHLGLGGETDAGEAR